MTLTGFLLARVAEDEERLGRVPPDLIGQPLLTRLLAECEAKRRIVEEIESSRAKATYTTRLLTILLYLALPYADHPDYRDEWRP